MSVVRVSELENLPSLTPLSQFLVSYGDGPTRVSHNIYAKDLYKMVSSSRYYGMYSCSFTQTNQLGEQPMNFDSIDIAYGFSTAGANWKIKAENDGMYNLQFSAQLTRTQGGSDSNLFIWFRKNGVDIPNSNTDIGFKNNNIATVAAWNILVQLNANDYVEIMWGSSDPNIQILATSSNPYGPAIPSVIATITQV